MKIGVGALWPTEEPTTCLGSTSSSDDLWGHQLVEAMLQASMSSWTWLMRVWLACSCVLACTQFAKQQPFRIQQRHTSWLPTMGMGGACLCAPAASGRGWSVQRLAILVWSSPICQRGILGVDLLQPQGWELPKEPIQHLCVDVLQ